ncbi:MAG: CAP domain-containing protein [Pseudomonadota bacterium]
MSMHIKYSTTLTTLLLAALLSACGGGGGASVSVPAPPSTLPSEPGAPAFVNNTATDGLNWINYRRGQLGIPTLLANSQVAQAAQAHSTYQNLNNSVSHDEVAGKAGYTGTTLLQRLNAAGYNFGSNGYAYGEVISATNSTSGFYMAEELITAIYHRFVIFEPKFKEIGTGSAATSAGYTYFTSDFTANNGYGPGIGRTNGVTWPFNGQSNVPVNFFSDYEAPDPVAGVNEVGYPVSVHADIDANLTVQSFTLRARGGAELSVKLLSAASDHDTPASAAAIIPLATLKAATTYDASFVGSIDGAAVSKTWSFTTK